MDANHVDGSAGPVDQPRRLKAAFPQDFLCYPITLSIASLDIISQYHLHNVN